MYNFELKTDSWQLNPEGYSFSAPDVFYDKNNHVNMLLSLPPALSSSRAVQLIKSGSSKWIHDEFPAKKKFAWQTGYAAYFVILGKLANAIDYIQQQKEHHNRKTFED
jgi:REP element-mobilizing transposase RayT